MAFPDPCPSEDGQRGMDLRDYFAARALSWALDVYSKGPDGFCVESLAEMAYRIADAMIAARKKGDGHV